ncbi:hypothetical protein ACQP1K_05110 [Sphaerimonospora sp. CA-214678]|uniref:hypothetical protein n=1 Tax=Sphaerimonospora sp. CA-214678 TaxID=3240029 RepID=UPI003D91C286
MLGLDGRRHGDADHSTISRIEAPGVKIRATTERRGPGTPSSGMIPPQNATMSSAFRCGGSRAPGTEIVMSAPDVIDARWPPPP